MRKNRLLVAGSFGPNTALGTGMRWGQTTGDSCGRIRLPAQKSKSRQTDGPTPTRPSPRPPQLTTGLGTPSLGALCLLLRVPGPEPFPPWV